MHDHLLIEHAQRGDRAAFETIIRAHQGAVYGYLRARLLEPADAEDLCQEVFLRCYLGGNVAANGSEATVPVARPWLIGIARNVLREHVRKTKRRKEVMWTELCLELDALVSTEDADYDRAIAFLPGCLESLGPTAKAALELRYQTCLRLAEIGDKLRRSEGAIKLLMHRARQALKLCLNGKLVHDSHD